MHTPRARHARFRLFGVLLAGVVLAIGLALVPSGFAKSGTGEHPGADKTQSSTHGDCKNAGSKSDTHNTTGTHNGYDCQSTSSPSTPPKDNDGDNDNPSDNDADDQGTTQGTTKDNDGDSDNPSDNDADDQGSTTKDNDGDSDNPSDNDADDQGTAKDNDGDSDNPGDHDADDSTSSPTSGTNGTNGTSGANGKVITVAGLQQVAGATARRPVACASRRRFTIHIRQIDHLKYTSATVFLGSKRLKTIRGSRRIHSGITLSGLPRGTFHVSITVHTSSGKTLRNVRTYHTCVPRRKHTTPKL